MNKTFLNQNTFNPELHSGLEINTMPSMTVPDQSLTIPQILQLYSRGIVPNISQKEGIGWDNPSFDDIDPTLDPAFDIIDAKRGLNEINQRIAESRKPKNNPPYQKSLDDAINEASENKSSTNSNLNNP